MKFESNADWVNFAKEQTHNDKTVMDEVNACAQSPKSFISEKALQMKSTAFRNDYISLAEDMTNASDQEAILTGRRRLFSIRRQARRRGGLLLAHQ